MSTQHNVKKPETSQPEARLEEQPVREKSSRHSASPHPHETPSSAASHGQHHA